MPLHNVVQSIIRKNGWKTVTFSDTAGAAKFIKKNAKRSQAALAPLIAAKLYGLDIIERNI
ncbi:hypothetical protein Q648_00090 [Bartonella quintana JK 12]|uniref:Prephenate dehydratase domain-containing protein n=2 Tax=Bartonella quintana TaxID=803 RepID=W3TVW1_BARQI|nr:hypothetical protein Q651_00414 [Bartonella quintana BQ2-D70]ETS13883.1 hypothetical protein Q650_00499 [Bartonella quintana JK 73rel]ETS15570.1 hypothetical protein Q649_00508 [Bartonella quintana JK 73]ETS17575.1 hypothetical protein Q647_00499 [Bartonella quintana JK 7]ETS18406.1 hypothetical protein Q648_00090 [Bartonella quintana JK 12]KEC59412.1 hypothetical protein O93_00743 [Bartonella quintana JK 19]KEC62479.1 hypothetical protein O7Y_00516 [Bartonella quintana JK 63]KEC63662.1 h